jgi:hypothetical protein
MKLTGKFKFRQRRNGIIIAEREVSNGRTVVGGALGLNILFNAEAKKTWYIGLVNAAGFTQLWLNDTMVSHPGWAELTDYSGSRKAYTTDAATTFRIDNGSSPALFNFTDLAVCQGAFLTTDSTKGGTAGTLFATTELGQDGDAGSLSLSVADEIELEYEISFTDV